MRTSVMVLAVVLAACGKSDSKSSPPPPPQQPEPPPPAAPPDAAVPPDAAPTVSDNDAIAAMVVHDVGSKALGSQTVDASCVAVSILPAGDWTVASAKLKDCGNKTARSIVWLFKRPTNGTWSEDYAGTPPKCWQGVPPDIVDAVAKLTKIPGC
jgi:hypothetical protein